MSTRMMQPGDEIQVRTTSEARALQAIGKAEYITAEVERDSSQTPIRRGRGRPRKNPVTITRAAAATTAGRAMAAPEPEPQPPPPEPQPEPQPEPAGSPPSSAEAISEPV